MVEEKADIDERCWPLIVITARGEPTEEKFDQFIAALDRYMACGQCTALVLDNSYRHKAVSAQNRRSVQWLKHNAEALKRWSSGLAMVFPSAAMRFALSGMISVQRMPMPYTICETRAEGIRWAASRLRADGVPVPPTDILLDP